jgi:ABC-type transporter Mla subunit MlaD
MRESSQVIGEGREDVNTIAGALQQISQAVSEAATRSEEIFHGADSHSLNAQSMVAAIEEIAKVASGNGRSVAELDRTMDGQLRTVDEIHRASERVNELADELASSLTIFRTGEGPVAPAVSARRPAAARSVEPAPASSPVPADLLDVVPTAMAERDEDDPPPAPLEDRF